MASKNIIIQIDDLNLTADVWQAFCELYNGGVDPEPSGTVDDKLTAAGPIIRAKLNEEITSRIRTNKAREARQAQNEIDLNL